MNESIIYTLIQNIAVLLALALLYESFWLQSHKPLSLISKIITGIILGLIGLVLMKIPWILVPGLSFDVRTVMLVNSGVFFGPLPTILAMLITGAFRAIIGGDGVWMGLTTIVSSGTIGILWSGWRKKWKIIDTPLEFLVLGFIVHAFMMGAVFLLPAERVYESLRLLALPMIIVFIPGTMLLGMLLAAQKRNFQNRIEKEKLYVKEHELREEVVKKQRQIEEQLEKYSKLNKGYRTQNKELKLAKEKAEESDRLKSAFLANLSHEIRTPMNAIMGFAGLLDNNELSEENRKKYVEIIKNSGKYLLSIINDILEISQIEAGQVELNKNRVEVNAFMKSIYDVFKISVEQSNKNIKFRLQTIVTETPLIFNTDEVKLNQIIINLLTNALKFTKEGEILLGYENNSNNEITFFVKDTGVGISPENHIVIFERFRQLEDNNTGNSPGSGLGLPITKAYVEMMEGSIKLISAENEGSEFRITFPFNQPGRTIKPEIKMPETKPVVRTANGKKVILVAEDEEINWFFIEQVLSRYNYKLIRVENGKEAVDICKNNNNIDLVLMDIKMPIMNGYEALEEIRKFNPKLPVIAQTAYALPNDIEKMKLVFDDYITKPINRQLLIEKIATVKASLQ